jgi:hypothetical protein
MIIGTVTNGGPLRNLGTNNYPGGESVRLNRGLAL